MRKQPQEFGFGVRGVQASPVDTFSPEVVQKPRAARGQAVSQGLSNLSQTLAGMAQQNRKYDDKKSPAGKTDYHTMGACYVVLEVLDGPLPARQAMAYIADVARAVPHAREPRTGRFSSSRSPLSFVSPAAKPPLYMMATLTPGAGIAFCAAS